MPLAFVLPALCYLKLDPGKLLTWNKLPAFLLVIFGLMVAIIGTIITTINVIDGVRCSHGMEMDYCFSSKSDILNFNYNNNTNKLLSINSSLTN